MSNKWQTADNNFIPIDELTQQHLSNIYWYHLIFQDEPRIRIAEKQHMIKIVTFAENEINKRFRGKILDWEPIFSFEEEWLIQLGLLNSTTKVITDFSGKIIGKFSENITQLR